MLKYSRRLQIRKQEGKMKNRLQKIIKGQEGQGPIVLVISIALAVYIGIILIRYLIIPALVGK